MCSLFSLSSFYLCSILLMLLKMKSFCCLRPSVHLFGNLAVKKKKLQRRFQQEKMGGKYENIEERAWQQAPFKMSRCLDLIVKFNLSRCFPNDSSCVKLYLCFCHIFLHIFFLDLVKETLFWKLEKLIVNIKDWNRRLSYVSVLTQQIALHDTNHNF